MSVYTCMRVSQGLLVAGFWMLLFSAGLSLALAKDEDRVCTTLYKPVCAAQVVQCIKAPCYPVYHTYSNECVAGDNKIVHEGECLPSETGPIKDTEATSTPPVVVESHWYDFFISVFKGWFGWIAV